MHRLLERQYKRYLGHDFEPNEKLQQFLAIIDSYYHEVDKEHTLLHNALVMNTAELNAVNERMRVQNEEMTHNLLNTLSDGVYATDLQGRLTFMNAAAERVLGWKEQELIGHLVHERLQQPIALGIALTSEDIPQLLVIQSGDPVDAEGHFIDHNGASIPVLYRSRPIWLEKKIVGALVAFQNISEKKNNERVMRLTQERLGLALDGSNLALWDWDLVNDRVYLSDRWSLMFGGANEESIISSEQLISIVHSEDREMVLSSLAAVLKGLNQFYTAEFRARRGSGEWFWVLTHGKVMERDATGRATRMTGTNADITERKKASEALQKSETKLRTLYESTSDAVMLLNEKGFFDCNQAALEMFGCASQAEFCTRHPADLSPEKQPNGMESMTLANQQIGIAIEKGSNRFEWAHRRADNYETFDAEVLLNAMELDGQLVLQATVRDISERKKYEEVLRKAKEDAEQANRAKSDFLANMSHEIRTPMNGIIGMTALALDTDLTQEQLEYINLVKLSSDSLLQIINDILDFSKIESGKMDIEIIEFSLGNMLRDTMKSLAESAHQKHLELLLHVAADAPDRLMGDPGRLRQVIVNLVSNAIKFTETGEIEVEVLCPAKLTGQHAQLRFSVRDTGIGIPSEKHRSIFESFSQADTSTTRKYGGTGLGLTISAQLVALMGGDITVDSEVGQGSTFHFTLEMPILSGNPLAKFQHTGQVEGMSVLVVDDNATNRKLLHEMLCSWKMLPTLVTNGEEALSELARASASNQPYALALLDVEMPGMDGFTLAERIRQHPDHVRSTVMMLTSEGQRGHAARCRDLGIASYLMKPVAQSDLLDAIMMTALGEPLQKLKPLITRHLLRETRRKMNLLLAEDNTVNQILAVRLLEKLGHQVTVANNGIEAVKHWQIGQFDAILMDVDMPELNGYEATQRIRDQERLSRMHIPIVAMTAHAMQGAREECLRHGMDDYLTKPIDTETLWRALNKLANEAKESNQPEPIILTRLAVADFEKTRQRMDDNHELFDQIARLFFVDGASRMRGIQDGLRTGDVEAVHRNAHALKGMVGIFSAERCVQAASEVEQCIVHSELPPLVGLLESTLQELNVAIRDYEW